MLAYFDTSAHDNQTLREIYGRLPTAEFLEWGLQRGIFARDGGRVVHGPEYGNPRQFCESDRELQELVAATPSAYGFACAGPRPADAVSRQVKLNQGVGREAIHAELRYDDLAKVAAFRHITTAAASKEAHLNSPSLGAHLSAESRGRLVPEGSTVQVLVSDGLSAEAVHHNVPDLVPVLLDGLAGKGISVGQPLLVRYGRVKLAEDVAERLGAALVIHLIGERPGGDALASRSLSAYLAYRCDARRFEYTVISNIYSGGLPPAEAAGVIVEKAAEILNHQAAGNRLEALLKTS
jgi:ethanolamine ammonia-lyase large subunit